MTTTQPRPGDKYQATAAVLRNLLGGAGNIAVLEHCVIRLRLTLTDRSRVNDTALRDHPAVLGVQERDTFQITVAPPKSPRWPQHSADSSTRTSDSWPAAGTTSSAASEGADIPGA